MSSYLKSAGTTSRLLAAAESVLSGTDTYREIVKTIESEHLQHAWEALGGIGDLHSAPSASEPSHLTKIRTDCLHYISSELARLTSFLDACSTIDEISPRSRDIVISLGEKLSASIFSSVLNFRGIPSFYVNLERVVEPGWSEGEVGQGFYDYLAGRLGECMEGAWDERVVGEWAGKSATGVEGWRVPVVTGGIASEAERSEARLTESRLTSLAPSLFGTGDGFLDLLDPAIDRPLFFGSLPRKQATSAPSPAPSSQPSAAATPTSPPPSSPSPHPPANSTSSKKSTASSPPTRAKPHSPACCPSSPRTRPRN
jgi:hypothetical protein